MCFHYVTGSRPLSVCLVPPIGYGNGSCGLYNSADAFLISGALLSSGRLSIILATLSLISFAASSTSILVKNSILIVLLPISESVSIDLIPSAPPTASSIGSDISDEIILKCEKVKKEVIELCSRFPIYSHLLKN